MGLRGSSLWCDWLVAAQLAAALDWLPRRPPPIAERAEEPIRSGPAALEAAAQVEREGAEALPECAARGDRQREEQAAQPGREGFSAETSTLLALLTRLLGGQGANIIPSWTVAKRTNMLTDEGFARRE